MIILEGVVCIYFVKKGIEVIGKWAYFVLPILIFVLLGIFLLSINFMNFNYIKPVLYQGIKPVLNAAISIFVFPFAETVLFLNVLGALDKKGKPFKVYVISLIIGGLIILLISVRNILVFGVETNSILYFSSYSAVSIINVGNFIQRLEVLVSVTYLLSGIIKVSVCLHSASLGIAALLNVKEYKILIAPIALLMMDLSSIVYYNAMDMFNWARHVYKYYAIPFQVILPILILILGKIKSRKKDYKDDKV